jgi:UDP-N-acetylglucosamine 2-epimerase
MSTLNQTYKELAIPYFKETFDCIDQIMRDHRTPYYLIGASAIALELLKDGIKPGRGTKDIDFAIMISTMADYDSISQALAEKGYNKVKAPWTFYSDNYNVAMFHPVTTEFENIKKYADNFVEALLEDDKNYVVIYPNNDHGSEIIINELILLAPSTPMIIPITKVIMLMLLIRVFSFPLR